MTGELRAITQDGRRVSLKPDGTWSFLAATEASSSQGMFRDMTWGTTYEKVMSSESDFLKEKEANRLVYHSELEGLPCETVYIFASNILVRGAYLLTAHHIQTSQYINSYNHLKQLVTEKYGAPKQDRTIWADDTYMKDPDRLGFALSRGDVSFFTRWETEDTDIALSMSCGDLDINTSLEYTSKEFGPLLERLPSEFARGI